MSADSPETEAKTGDLATTLATWIFLLHQSGHMPDDAAVRGACLALNQAGPDDDVDALGQDLAGAVRDALGGDGSSANVAAWLGLLYGSETIGSFGGESREDRLRAARSYQFQSSLPWLAEIIDRFPDGTVGPHWVMVERITDTVTCADPYPWDDLDEEYDLDIVEFLVKWELAGLNSVRWQGGGEDSGA